MQTRRFAAAAAALFTLALGACRDGTGPDPVVTGGYVLASVDDRQGDPVVVSEFVHPNGHRRLLTMRYDTLRFTSDTTVQRSWELSYEEWYPDGTRAWEPLVSSASSPGIFERVDDRIIVRTMPGFTPIPTDTFHIRSGTLVRNEWTGFGCQDGCPPPVLSEFVYARD